MFPHFSLNKVLKVSERDQYIPQSQTARQFALSIRNSFITSWPHLVNQNATKTLFLLRFKFSDTWPLSRNKNMDLCCELHLHCLSKPVNRKTIEVYLD